MEAGPKIATLSAGAQPFKGIKRKTLPRILYEAPPMLSSEGLITPTASIWRQVSS
jgi:hypothetical protein